MNDDAMKQLPPVEAWRDGLDDGLAALVQQKGWRSAKDVLSSYQNLEKRMGAERLALPPRDAGAEAWGPVWEKLGRPKEASLYQLQAPEGRPYDADTADWYRQTAFDLGLTQEQAARLHDALLARFPAGTGEAPIEAAEPPLDLKRQWGPDFERNLAAARRAYATFMDKGDAEFHAIADQLGDGPLMDLLARVGRATAEDSITARAESRSGGPRSAAEARAEIAKLQQAAKSDARHPYINKTHPEHAATVKRMEDLFAQAYGG
ncbi:hypothetical protein [Dongia sp.]|uniref:hypothetical protein n=1 Tax=Dongia sp. TaxID=1977262 RepID=UPI0035AFE0C9